MLTQIEKTLMGLPLARIKTAAQAHSVMSGDKLDMCRRLAVLVDNGTTTVQRIAGAAATPAAAPTAHQVVVDAVRTQDVKDLQTTVDTLIRVVSTQRQSLDSAAHIANKAHAASLAHGAALDKIDASLSALQGKVDAARVDTGAAAVLIAQAVEQAFGPFKQAVIDAGAQDAVVAVAAAAPAGQDHPDNVFGITTGLSANIMLDIYNHNDAPPVDNTFIWRSDIVRHLVQSQYTGENIWLGGEKGTGKTQTIMQFAARTGRAFTRINFHKYTTVEEYIGAVGLVNGATQFVEGPFLRAFTAPGSVILLDEVSNCDAGELAMLNGLLEPGAAVTIHGKVYRRAAGVMVFAADNTLGSGDASGRYAGVRQMNAALLDRFARTIPFAFLPADVEADALVKHTGCTRALALHVVAAINVCRQQLATGALVDAPSLRQAMAFIRACSWHTVADAWATTIASKQPAEGLVALEAVYAANINPGLIESNIKGV